MDMHRAILKFDFDGLGCNYCYFNEGCTGKLCSDGKPEGIIDDDYHYANIFQVRALIEEAETREPTLWVRQHGSFVCNNSTRCNGEFCTFKDSIVTYDSRYSESCCFSNRGVAGSRLVPYRGARPEEATAEDCKVVEITLNDDLSIVVKSESGELDETGGRAIDEEDRSDLEYNKKKELVKNAGIAGTMNADEFWGKELKVYPDKKAAVEVIEDQGEVEYVVVKHFTMADLRISEHISDKSFRHLMGQIDYGAVGESFMHDDPQEEAAVNDLLAGGFIKEQVENPIVNQGDSFESPSGISRIVQVKDNEYMLIGITSCNREFNTKIERSGGVMHLSDFIGMDNLKRFKKVNVTITVEED